MVFVADYGSGDARRCADAPVPPKIVTLADALNALPEARIPDGVVS